MSIQYDSSKRLAGIPGRVFLDTSVVNFMLDSGAEIHDGAVPPDHASEYIKRDIDAFYNVFLTGQRAMWQFAISPHTYFEVAATQDPERRKTLDGLFGEIWQYWRETIARNDDLPSFRDAENLRISLSSGMVALPDLSDRVLISDAVVYRCELFCTRDWTTILKHRSELAGVPIEIVTPTEWWTKIRPYAALWA